MQRRQYHCRLAYAELKLDCPTRPLAAPRLGGTPTSDRRPASSRSCAIGTESAVRKGVAASNSDNRDPIAAANFATALFLGGIRTLPHANHPAAKTGVA